MHIGRRLLHKGSEVCYLKNPIRDGDNFPEMEIIDAIDFYSYRCTDRFGLLDFFKIKRLQTRINADVYYLNVERKLVNNNYLRQ